MRGFMGSRNAQADGFDCWLSFAAEPAFDFDFVFDLNELGSCRGAERQTDQGRRMFERSEFGAPRHDCHDKRSPTGHPAQRAGRRTRR